MKNILGIDKKKWLDDSAEKRYAIVERELRECPHSLREYNQEVHGARWEYHCLQCGWTQH